MWARVSDGRFGSAGAAHAAAIALVGGEDFLRVLLRHFLVFVDAALHGSRPVIICGEGQLHIAEVLPQRMEIEDAEPDVDDRVIEVGLAGRMLVAVERAPLLGERAAVGDSGLCWKPLSTAITASTSRGSKECRRLSCRMVRETAQTAVSLAWRIPVRTTE